jgi:Flp pilus assembly protein TadG
MTIPNRTATSRLPSRQRGSAAIEAALILPVMVILLSFPLFFGRVFAQYTVLQKAAQDGARYMSSIPRAEMRSLTLSSNAAAIASQIVAAELAGTDSFRNPPRIAVQCGADNCTGFPGNSPLPTKVSVRIATEILNPFLFVENVTSDGMHIEVEVEVPYAGN